LVGWLVGWLSAAKRLAGGCRRGLAGRRAGGRENNENASNYAKQITLFEHERRDSGIRKKQKDWLIKTIGKDFWCVRQTQQQQQQQPPDALRISERGEERGGGGNEGKNEGKC
jgi:hypothetical protein